MAALADGLVITCGGPDGRVLVWDPAHPGVSPDELARHDGWVRAVAALADGRITTSGYDGRMLVWDLSEANAKIIQLTCSVTALVAVLLTTARSELVIAHEGTGISLWSFTK